MGNIPSIDNWRAPAIAPPSSVGFSIPGGAGGAIQEARHAMSSAHYSMMRAFNQIDNAGEQLTDIGRRMLAIDQQTKLTEAQSKFTDKLDELRDVYSNRDDWDTMADSFKKDARETFKEYGAGLKDEYANSFNQNIAAEVGKAYQQIKSTARKGKIDLYKASIGAASELSARKMAAAGYDTTEAAAVRVDFISQINGALAVGAIGQTEAFKMMQSFDENVDTVAAKTMIIKDPLQANALLKNPDVLKNLDPMKRQNLLEESIAHARQLDSQRERDEARAERLQNKLEKQRGAEIVAKAAASGTTLPELRQLLRDGKISASDFNHAQTLLRQSIDGSETTDMDQYVKMYAAARDGSISKDDIIESKKIAPKEKIKLLDLYAKAQTAEDKLERPLHKNDRDILRATLKPGGPFSVNTPEREQAYAYAVEHYDKLIRSGMDNVEARDKVLATWEPKAKMMGTGKMYPPPTIGTPDMDEVTFATELKRALTTGKVTEQQAIEQLKRWKYFQITPVDSANKGGKR